jgi:hypothetical protein
MIQSVYKGSGIEALDLIVETIIDVSVKAELGEEGASSSILFFTIREEAVRQEAQLLNYEGEPTEDDYTIMLTEALFQNIFNLTLYTWPQ